MKRRQSIQFVASAAVALASVAEAIVYVDLTQPGGNGTSWAQAYSSLGAAIAARGNNEEFWIANGIYQPTATMFPKAGSQIYGGFAGNETSRTQRSLSSNFTAFDGQDLRSLFYIKGTSANVRVDTLCIAQGNGTHTGAAGLSGYGGGLVADSGTSLVTVANCILSDNNSATRGGAMYFYRRKAQVENCLFLYNTSPSGGGLGAELCSVVVSNSAFGSNTATSAVGFGGGIFMAQCTALVVSCSFTQNQAALFGGGLFFSYMPGSVLQSRFVSNSAVQGGGGVAFAAATGTVDTSTFLYNTTATLGGGYYDNLSVTRIRDCLFQHNRAREGGGAMMDFQAPGGILIERTRFLSNVASNEGGGFHSYVRSVYVDNSIFDGNSAVYGGGVGTHAGTPTPDPAYVARFRNCDFLRNSASGQGGGMLNSYVPSLQLYNCIFRDNAGSLRDIANAGSSTLLTRYCDIQTYPASFNSASESHTGTFSADPLFSQGTNYVLTTSSPCVDAGDGDNAPATDLSGAARVDYPSAPNTGAGSPTFVDIGAFELIPVGDVDGDGLPDSWEQFWFGGPTNATASADNDVDGMDNWEEYIADTAPGNPSSYLRLEWIAHTDLVDVAFASSTARVYRVQRSDDLGSWTDFAGPFAGNGGTSTVSDVNGGAKSFYRIQAAQP